MNPILNTIIALLHILYVSFVVITPFYGTSYFLLIHSIIIPFMMMHWIMNDNTCALTIMEKKLRETMSGGAVNKSDCFMSNLIEPIYDFRANNNEYASLIYFVTITLWLIGVYKLYDNFSTGKIRSVHDLLKV